MPKVVLALCWCEGVEQVSDPSPRGFNGTLIGLSEGGLELGDSEGMNATGSSECPIDFDGVQVWAVGVGGARKRPGGAFPRTTEQQMGSGVSDHLSGGQAFVAAEVISDDDITGAERRGETLADPGGERLPGDRPVQHERSHDTVMAQSGQEE